MKKIILSLLLVLILGCTDKTDTKGFYIEGKNRGIHKETKTKYDKDGYNYKGFNKDGYNAEGYDEEGFDLQGYDEEGFDLQGYDKDGYNYKGFNKDGYNAEGYDEEGFDLQGYDKDGFNKGGFTRYGFNKKNEFEKNKFYKYKFEESKFIFANRYVYDKTQTMLTNGLRDIFIINKNLKNLKKDEFETTSEFEIRKKNLVKKYSKEIEDIKNEYYIIYSRTNSYIEGKYDADNEEWSFNETYKTSSNDYYNSHYDYKFKNSPITINSKVKMPVLEAKSKKSLKAIIRFLVTDTTFNTDYNKSFLDARNFFEAKVVAYQIYTVFENEQKLVKEGYID